MKYTEILNRRLKKAGREYRTGNHSDKKERLWNAIQVPSFHGRKQCRN